MITYELSKKLKDSGFPQKFDIGKSFYSEEYAKFGNVENLIDGRDKISVPTLSELIKACKPVRILLTEEQEGQWFCFGNNSIKAYGSTPEEAVSLLWLELNKK